MHESKRKKKYSQAIRSEIIVDSPNQKEWIAKLHQREKRELRTILRKTGTLQDAELLALKRLKDDLNRERYWQQQPLEDRSIHKEPCNSKTKDLVQKTFGQTFLDYNSKKDSPQ